MQLSAVIITHNEEENIERCLRSLIGIVDDVVIVDSESSDRTREICMNYSKEFKDGLNFNVKSWEGYSKSKNFGNQLALNSFVLSIDADEELDSVLRQHILKLDLTPNTVYNFNRKNFLLNLWVKHCGWYPDWKTRIFSKTEVKWAGDFVHEKLVIPKAALKINLEGHLNHYTAATDEAHLRTIRKYSRLKAQSYIDASKNYTFTKSFFQAIGNFVKIFFIKGGFQDGRLGWKVAIRSARGRLWRYHAFKELKAERAI